MVSQELSLLCKTVCNRFREMSQMQHLNLHHELTIVLNVWASSVLIGFHISLTSISTFKAIKT